MELWITRDELGLLELHHKKPIYSYMYGFGSWKYGDLIGRIDKDLLPEVTFENSPQKVELKLVKEETK